jgi:hypothetical protein
MVDFVDRAEDAFREKAERITIPDFERVFNLLAAFQVLHAKTNIDTSNIESVFNIVEMGRILRLLPGQFDSEEVSQSVRRVLAETIQHYCRFHWRPRQWHPTGSYQALVRSMVRRGDIAAFITFNYDIALDFALHFDGWAVDYGLGHGGVVPLLKLHGSLNWTTCSCGEVVPVNVHEVFHGVDALEEKAYAMDVLRTLQGRTPHCAKGVLSGEPAIVPPSWNKTQYQHSIGQVWRRAAKELSDAVEVTVIGYSLPDSDAFFREFFALGLCGPTRLRRLHIINTDDGVRERFEKLLGPECRPRLSFDKKRFEEIYSNNIPDDGSSFAVPSLRERDEP